MPSRIRAQRRGAHHPRRRADRQRQRVPGQEFERIVASLDVTLTRPDRKDEPPRFGSLGCVRQWIESIINAAQSQLSLELTATTDT
jgi:hypothetical protein